MEDAMMEAIRLEKAKWPVGDGEMAARVRTHDWAATPLGPIEEWPAELKSAVAFVLDSAFPAALVWGPGLVTIYNDGFRPILGSKPEALGRSFAEIWSEAWHEIGPIAERALAGQATFIEDYPLVINRAGEPEQAFFTFSYSPVRAADGSVVGMIDTVVETTKGVLARERLRHSEERLRRMLETDAVGVLFFDHDGVLIDANDVFLNITGWSREEVASRSLHWRRMIPSESIAESEAQMQRLAETGRIGPYEKEYVRKDGSRSWMLFAGRDLGDGTIVEFGIDIEERKRTEAALRESEAQLAVNLAGMHRLYDLHARLASETDLKVALNEILAAACEFTHTERGCVQLVSDDGERLEMFAWQGYGDDSPFINHFRYEGLKQGRDVARVERRRSCVEDWEKLSGLTGTELEAVLRADNIRASQSTPLVSRKGETLGVLSTQFAYPHRPSDDELKLVDLLAWTGADFVARHRAEAALRENQERHRIILASVRDYAIYTTDPEGRIETWPPGAERVFGWTAAEIIGQPAAITFTPEDRERGEPEREFEKARETGHAANLRWHMRKDGSRVFIEGSTRTLQDGGSGLRGFLIVGQDVTERQRVEEALQASESRAKLLLAELQHRVRNTLGVVRSIARRTAATSETVQDYAMHLEGRINAFARVQTAVTRNPTSGIDLTMLVADELLAHGAHEKERVRQLQGPKLRLQPKAAETFALAIHELATNAVKYGALATPTGRIDVEWTIENTDGEGRLVFDWVESGVKISGQKLRSGFGTELIERTLVYELGGETSLRFDPDGLRCTIRLPVNETLMFE